MTRLTISQKAGLDNMNVNSQRAGGLGTRIDELEYGGISAPDVGTLTPLAGLVYTTAPDLGTATYVHAAYTLGATGVNVTTSITNPDVPRIASIKGNAGGITGAVVLTGTNIDDTVITDSIDSDGSSEVFGIKAFKSITNIAFPMKTNVSGDSISIGVGDSIGLPMATPNASVVFAFSFDDAADAGSVTAAATVEQSVYAVAGTLDGEKELALYFLV
jgi:hypothetical protein